MSATPSRDAVSAAPSAGRGRLAGFTLIELLVVIAVVALLVSLAMPVVNQALHSASKAACTNQLKQIYTAFQGYITQYDFRSHRAPNYGMWEKPLGTILAPSNTYAYWGVAYAPYLGNNREVFRCPSALTMWQTTGYADWENQPQATYGLNYFVSNKVIPAKFRKPSNTILAQDAYEHLIEGNGDLLSIRAGDSINLTQWRHIPGSVYEYFRHNDNCNLVWLDGHATAVFHCNDYPIEHYTGK